MFNAELTHSHRINQKYPFSLQTLLHRKSYDAGVLFDVKLTILI